MGRSAGYDYRCDGVGTLVVEKPITRLHLPNAEEFALIAVLVFTLAVVGSLLVTPG